MDFINTRPLPGSVEKQVLIHLDNFADTFDVLFVSDQAETKQGGVVTPAVRERLLKIAESNPAKADLGGLARSRGALSER